MTSQQSLLSKATKNINHSSQNDDAKISSSHDPSPNFSRPQLWLSNVSSMLGMSVNGAEEDLWNLLQHILGRYISCSFTTRFSWWRLLLLPSFFWAIFHGVMIIPFSPSCNYAHNNKCPLGNRCDFFWVSKCVSIAILKIKMLQNQYLKQFLKISQNKSFPHRFIFQIWSGSYLPSTIL